MLVSFYNKVKDFASNHKKIILYILAIMATLFFIGDFVSAEDKTGAIADKESVIMDLIHALLAVASATIVALTALIGLLLNPGWINGTIFGFHIYLRDIWVMISNVVYLIFAFLLIAIAFMNIIGKGQNNWELKTALPKFIIGVLIVPFSWLFVQFTLSISSFLTIEILGIPYDTMNGKEAFKKHKDKSICSVYVLDMSGQIGDMPKKEEGCSVDFLPVPGQSTISVDKLLSGKALKGVSSRVFSLISIYTHQIMNIDSALTLYEHDIQTGKDKIKKLTSLTLKMLIDLIFIIMFFLLMVALFLALFSRGVWLWIHTMFSPVYGLFYFFGTQGDEETKKISPLEFIKLALVPVYVSAALSFGLLFLMVVTHGLSEVKPGKNPIYGWVKKDGSVAEPAKGAAADQLYPAVTLGDFRLIVKGKAGGGAKEDSDSFFGQIGGGFGHIILQLFGLAILWISIMAALKASDITKAVTDPIREFGTSIGKLVSQAPGYVPIIPNGKGGLMSTTALSRVGSSVNEHYRAAAVKPGNEFADRFFDTGVSAALKEELNKVGSKLKNNGGGQAELQDFQDTYKKLKNVETAMRNPETQNILNRLAKRVDVETKGVYDDKNSYLEFVNTINKKLSKSKAFSGKGLVNNEGLAIQMPQLEEFFQGVNAPKTDQKKVEKLSLSDFVEDTNMNATSRNAKIETINNIKVDGSATKPLTNEQYRSIGEKILKHEKIKDLTEDGINDALLGMKMDKGIVSGIVGEIKKIRKEEKEKKEEVENK